MNNSAEEQKPTLSLRFIDLTRVKPQLTSRDFLNLDAESGLSSHTAPELRLIDLSKIKPELTEQDILNLSQEEQEGLELRLVDLAQVNTNNSRLLLRLEGDGIWIEVRQLGDGCEFVSTSKEALEDLLLILGVDATVIAQIPSEGEGSPGSPPES